MKKIIFSICAVLSLMLIMIKPSLAIETNNDYHLDMNIYHDNQNISFKKVLLGDILTFVISINPASEANGPYKIETIIPVGLTINSKSISLESKSEATLKLNENNQLLILSATDSHFPIRFEYQVEVTSLNIGEFLYTDLHFFKALPLTNQELTQYVIAYDTLEDNDLVVTSDFTNIISNYLLWVISFSITLKSLVKKDN